MVAKKKKGRSILKGKPTKSAPKKKKGKTGFALLGKKPSKKRK